MITKVYGTGLMMWGLVWIGAGITLFQKSQKNKFKIFATLSIIWGIISIIFGYQLICYQKLNGTCSIDLYTMRGCGHCDKAKAELQSKNVDYQEHEYIRGQGQPPPMPDGTRPKMFPTIWVNGKRVNGGSDMSSWISQC